MFRVINSIQAVAAFVAMPFGIAWLTRQDFPGQTAAIVAAVVLYGLCFCLMVGSVYNSTENWDRGH